MPDDPLTMTELMGQLSAEQHIDLARRRFRIAQDHLERSLRRMPDDDTTAVGRSHIVEALRILNELMPKATV